MTSAPTTSTPDDNELDRPAASGVAAGSGPAPDGWPEWSLAAAASRSARAGPDVGPDVDPHAADGPRVPGYIVPQFERSRDEDVAADAGSGGAAASSTGDGVAATSTADEARWQRPTGPGPEVDAMPDDRPARRGSQRILGVAIGLSLAVAVGLVSVTLVRFVGDSDRGTRGTAAPPSGSPAVTGSPAAAVGPSASGSPAAGPENVVSGALGATRTSEFQLASGVTAVTVRTADIGDSLYRAVTPEDSGFVPVVAVEGEQVRLRLARTRDGDGRASVAVELNARVRWKISMLAGAETAAVDLRSASLAGVDIVGGVSRIEMWLPKPQGVVAVRMSGGAHDFVIHAPARVPVRVGLARGAAEVTIDGAKRSGVASGKQFASPRWAQAPDRYDVAAIAGLAVLTLDRY